jgi:hypothetical protein
VALVALPWLSVKYVPVTAALAALVLWRLLRERRAGPAAWLALALTVAGVAYLALHQLIWGGWTVYASGDFFVPTGEFSVVGAHPDYLGRSVRLVGLMFDNDYGIAPWQLGWLLVLAALPAMLRRRPAGTAALVVPLLAGWGVATWVAVTMAGFWWPGRQLVIVLPLAVVAILWWLAEVAGPKVWVAAAVLGATGVAAFVTLLIDGYAGQITWVSGFQHVDDPQYAALRPLLPDYRTVDTGMWIRHGICIALVAALALAGWRSAGRPRTPHGSSSSEPDTDPARSLTSSAIQ